MKNYYFTYREEDGHVTCFSKKKNKQSTVLQQIKLKVEEDVTKQLLNGWQGFIINEEIVLRKSPDREKKDEITEAKEDIQQKLEAGTVTNEDIVNLLLKL